MIALTPQATALLWRDADADRQLDALRTATIAQRGYKRASRTARRAERIPAGGRLIHPAAPHGTTNGYSNFGCRCEDCGTAHRNSERARLGLPVRWAA